MAFLRAPGVCVADGRWPSLRSVLRVAYLLYPLVYIGGLAGVIASIGGRSMAIAWAAAPIVYIAVVYLAYLVAIFETESYWQTLNAYQTWAGRPN